MSLKNKTFFIASGLLAIPFMAFAALNAEGILIRISGLINTAIPVVLALAVLYFFWGLAKYVLNQSDEGKKEEGRNIMIWGIIALFIMVSVWGLIGILQRTFSIDPRENPIIPGEIKRGPSTDPSINPYWDQR